MTLAIKLPKDIEDRLTRLSRATGRPKSFYAQEAILLHIEELEDTYLAEQVLDRIQRGEEETIAAKDFWRELDD